MRPNYRSRVAILSTTKCYEYYSDGPPDKEYEGGLEPNSGLNSCIEGQIVVGLAGSFPATISLTIGKIAYSLVHSRAIHDPFFLSQTRKRREAHPKNGERPLGCAARVESRVGSDLFSTSRIPGNFRPANPAVLSWVDGDRVGCLHSGRAQRLGPL